MFHFSMLFLIRSNARKMQSFENGIKARGAAWPASVVFSQGGMELQVRAIPVKTFLLCTPENTGSDVGQNKRFTRNLNTHLCDVFITFLEHS